MIEKRPVHFDSFLYNCSQIPVVEDRQRYTEGSPSTHVILHKTSCNADVLSNDEYNDDERLPGMSEASGNYEYLSAYTSGEP